MQTRKTMTIVAAIVLLMSGCAHHQLTYDSVHHAKTLNNIYEQQVLDNLAMFHADPNALPFFALPSAGGNKVTDKGSVTAAKPLNPFFTTIGLGADRTIAEDWTLTAVSDPDKLKRMRCAYQRAVGYFDETCIDCCELDKEWFGKPDTVVTVIGVNGRPIVDGEGNLLKDPRTNEPYLVEQISNDYLINDDPTTGEPYVLNQVHQTLARTITVKNTVVTVIGVDGQPIVDGEGNLLKDPRTNEPYLVEQKNCVANNDPTTGEPYVLNQVDNTLARTITLENYDCYGECAINSCFYYCREKAMIPQPCDRIGHYCGTYVGVLPHGRDQFTRLVLTILDYAVNDPKPAPARRMQTIETRTYNSDNLIATITTRQEPIVPFRSERPIAAGPNESAEKFRLRMNQFLDNEEAEERRAATGVMDRSDPAALKYFMPEQPRPRSTNNPFSVERNRQRLRDQF